MAKIFLQNFPPQHDKFLQTTVELCNIFANASIRYHREVSDYHTHWNFTDEMLIVTTVMSTLKSVPIIYLTEQCIIPNWLWEQINFVWINWYIPKDYSLTNSDQLILNNEITLLVLEHG